MALTRFQPGALSPLSPSSGGQFRSGVTGSILPNPQSQSDALAAFQAQISGSPSGGTTNPNTGLGNAFPTFRAGSTLYGGGFASGTAEPETDSAANLPASAATSPARTVSTGFQSPLDVGNPSTWPATWNVPPELSGNVSGTPIGAGGTEFGPAELAGGDYDLGGQTGNVPTGDSGGYDADLGGDPSSSLPSGAGPGGAGPNLTGSAATDKTALNKIAGFGIDWLVRAALIALGAALVIVAAWALLRGEGLGEAAKAIVRR